MDLEFLQWPVVLFLDYDTAFNDFSHSGPGKVLTRPLPIKAVTLSSDIWPICSVFYVHTLDIKLPSLCTETDVLLCAPNLTLDRNPTQMNPHDIYKPYFRNGTAKILYSSTTFVPFTSFHILPPAPHYYFIICSGSAAQRGLWPPRSRGFWSHTATRHSR
jgi:hypothetical protein